jgi:hypothetical protein
MGLHVSAVERMYRVAYWQAHEPWQANGALGPLLRTELRVSNAFRVVE